MQIFVFPQISNYHHLKQIETDIPKTSYMYDALYFSSADSILLMMFSLILTIAMGGLGE